MEAWQSRRPGLDVPPVRASYGCRAGAVCGLAPQGRPDWPRYRSLGARTYGPSDRAVQARVAIIRVQKEGRHEMLKETIAAMLVVTGVVVASARERDVIARFDGG